MIIAHEIQRGLIELEDACSLTGNALQMFIWKGVNVPCVPTAIGRGVQIDTHGNTIEIDLILFVRLGSFLTADSTLVTVDSDLYTADQDAQAEGRRPLSGLTLSFRGVTYRIITARESLGHVELTLADPASNK
jgi:hypothetical protein